MKGLIAECFLAALRALDPAPAIHAALAARRSELLATRRVCCLSFGKAARPMAQAAIAALRELAPACAIDGLLVPPEPDDRPLPPLEVVPGGHPLPTQGSFDAAARALELCRRCDADTLALFLVSGGASSLLELPAVQTTLAEWRAFYRDLVGSGLGIAAINQRRTAASRIKGGQLAQAARAAKARWTLAISDVPGSDLASLGSGPSIDGSQDPATILLDNSHATVALVRLLEARGIAAHVVTTWDEAGCDEAAAGLWTALEQRAAGRRGPTAVVAGGEVRVALPPDPGCGGRNSHFLLTCASRIEGQPVTVLSCGTDGIDGGSDAAGGIVDGRTGQRARARGLDPQAFLARFDSATLLAKLGDAIRTGPTGANVRDVRILLAHGQA